MIDFNDIKKIRIASDEEMEDCAMVVCMPVGPSEFDDNVETTCAHCGHAIMHRPHVPRRPPKLCVPCVLWIVEATKGQRPN